MEVIRTCHDDWIAVGMALSLQARHPDLGTHMTVVHFLRAPKEEEVERTGEKEVSGLADTFLPLSSLLLLLLLLLLQALSCCFKPCHDVSHYIIPYHTIPCHTMP